MQGISPYTRNEVVTLTVPWFHIIMSYLFTQRIFILYLCDMDIHVKLLPAYYLRPFVGHTVCAIYID